MRIYIGHSNDFNFKEELYMPIRDKEDMICKIEEYIELLGGKI